MAASELSEEDRKIIAGIQGDLPLTEEPFKELADKLGIPEERLLEKIRSYVEKGYIRRLGAALRHRETGFAANGMGVWKVPPEKADETGETMATFSQVSHCYQRPTFPGWDYNLFTMIHGKTEEECRATAKAISEATGITEYKILFSSRELKKSTMLYFQEEDDF